MLPQILIVVMIYAHASFTNSVMKTGSLSNRSQLGGETGEIISTTLVGKDGDARENDVDTLDIQDGNSRSRGSTVVHSDSSLPRTTLEEHDRSNAGRYSKANARHTQSANDSGQTQVSTKRKFCQQQNRPEEIQENDENGGGSIEITASKEGDQKSPKKRRLDSELEKRAASCRRLTEVSLLSSENCHLTDPMQQARA
jgi:hypothetical protein